MFTQKASDFERYNPINEKWTRDLVLGMSGARRGQAYLIFRKWDVGIWTGSSWLRIGTGGDTCDCSNEPSVSIECGEFLDYLKNG
jgi:hypothetical protein